VVELSVHVSTPTTFLPVPSLPPPISTLFPYTTLFRSVNIEELEIRLLLEAIYSLYGYDFRQYSKASLRRRILHRLGLSGLNTIRSEEHTSELQSRENLVCRLLLEKKKKKSTLRLTRTH